MEVGEQVGDRGVVGREGGALDGEERGFVVDGAEEGEAAAGLVWVAGLVWRVLWGVDRGGVYQSVP